MNRIKHRLYQLYFAAYKSFSRSKKWKKIEYFDETWKERINSMSRYIMPGQSVIDLGCGEMWLKDYLSNECKYIPVDYKDRGKGTIICDFNDYQFPEISADVAFVSGCLEYIEDYSWFINRISNSTTYCIISYCTLESFPEIYQRKQSAWVNNLTKNELIIFFKKNRMNLEDYVSNGGIEIFYFKK